MALNQLIAGAAANIAKTLGDAQGAYSSPEYNKNSGAMSQAFQDGIARQTTQSTSTTARTGRETTNEDAIKSGEFAGINSAIKMKGDAKAYDSLTADKSDSEISNIVNTAAQAAGTQTLTALRTQLKQAGVIQDSGGM
ncbi:MAG: hypothetical protein RL154_905, partial [Pseudomonadota bacterium]